MLLVPVGDADAMAATLRRLIESRSGRIGYPMDAYRIEAKLAKIEAFYREGLARLRQR